MNRTGLIFALLAGLLAASPGMVQESASFRLEESAFNAGGHPQDGATLQSPSFSITLHSIGQGIAAPSLSALSFSMEAGLVAEFAPPGEVLNLRFIGQDELAWDPDRSTGDYALYRGTVGPPVDPSFGACLLPVSVVAGATDSTTPSAGEALFYLVTARNRLHEEGTKGAGSDDQERPNPLPCP